MNRLSDNTLCVLDNLACGAQFKFGEHSQQCSEQVAKVMTGYKTESYGEPVETCGEDQLVSTHDFHEGHLVFGVIGLG